jgi:hypothetical protein
LTARKYASPEAFKQALEQRLRTEAKSGAAFANRRQFLVFDRFLARVVQLLGSAVTLKGGLVLEIRLDRARTTKDIDLRLRDLRTAFSRTSKRLLVSISETSSRSRSGSIRIGPRFRATG